MHKDLLKEELLTQEQADILNNICFKIFVILNKDDEKNRKALGLTVVSTNCYNISDTIKEIFEQITNIQISESNEFVISDKSGFEQALKINDLSSEELFQLIKSKVSWSN